MRISLINTIKILGKLTCFIALIGLSYEANCQSSPIHHYDDWSIQNSYLSGGKLLLLNSQTKQIKFDVGIFRFTDQNGNYLPVNFVFHLRRLAPPGHWCGDSEEISSNFSITSSDFEDEDANYTEKEFTVTVTVGSEDDELKDGDHLLLFVNDATLGFSCSNWFPVDEEYEVDILTVPGQPTNLTITNRTGNGSTVSLNWVNNGANIDAGQIRKKAPGGNWSNPINSGINSALNVNIGTSAQDFQARSHNAAGWGGWSSVVSVAALDLTAPTDLEVFKPYNYSLKWTDPNPAILTGNIEVQKGGYYGNPDAFYTIVTLNDFHLTSYYLGTTLPNQKYRLKFTDSFGRIIYSNVADEAVLYTVTDLEVIHPYHYNLQWSDPNSSLFTGTIYIQKNGYYNDPNSYYNIATITNFHATTYYLGSSNPGDSKYRLKMVDQGGNIVYSNIAQFGMPSGKYIDMGSNGSEPDVKVIFEAFPSPADQVLYLRVDSPKGVSYEIFDIQGKKGVTGILSEFSVDSIAKIDISDLESGMYFINLKGLGTKKFLVK